MSKDEILMELLECGILDLNMLDDCEYDFYDVLEECHSFTSEPKFCDILYGAICIYQRNIQNKIDDRISELNDLMEEFDDNGEADTEEFADYEEEQRALESLNPNEDIEHFINFIDTSIYIRDEQKKVIYSKYLSDAINEENQEIGFVSLEV